MSAAEYIPTRVTIKLAQVAVSSCRGCPLWRGATQGVFGKGSRRASLMLIGEQPDDREDIEGRPFVGPAGAFLDKALDEAGIDRGSLYLTNAVKHFKWARDERSKRRIHKKPSDSEVRACFPWLETEFKLVKPQVVVLLGATAAKAVMGKTFRVTQDRGKMLSSAFCDSVVATVHPSSILRAMDSASRRQAMKEFVRDLSIAREALG